MKKSAFSIFALVIMLLTACVPQAAPTPTIVKTQVTATSQPAPTAIPTAIPTIVPPTQTPLPQPTATPALTSECLTVEQQLPVDLELSGVWVMNEYSPYIHNLAENTEYRIPLEGGGSLIAWEGSMAISPDRLHLAYIDHYYKTTGYVSHLDKKVLRVIRSSGHALDMSFWTEDWQDIIGWVDNENLALRDGKGTIVILNPITGNWHIFNGPDWVDAGTTSAEISGKTVSILKDGVPYAQFNISRLGNNYIYDLKLSPNGQKLAFGGELAVLDIEKQQFYQMCDEKYHSSWGTLTWSPDNRFVVEPVYTSEGYDYQHYDLLIDTQTLRSYLLNSGDYQHIIAWLAQP